MVSVYSSKTVDHPTDNTAECDVMNRWYDAGARANPKSPAVTIGPGVPGWVIVSTGGRELLIATGSVMWIAMVK